MGFRQICPSQKTLTTGHHLTKTRKMMQRSDEKLCLQWNDFRDNVSSAFGDLRDDKEFTDVTLACEDGQQVEAHKVVLLSSSPFFLNLLKRNKHPHPLVYMRGLKHENLLSMVDFLYHGEANVYQENLDIFLAMADELQLKGLKKGEEEEVETIQEKVANRPISQGSANNTITTSKHKTTLHGPKKEVATSSITEIALSNFSTDLVELDQKVKSMMTTSENRIGKQNKRERICKVCGKEGHWMTIKNHIEAKHLTDISIPCNACDKILNTRAALVMHQRRHHSQS